VEWCAERWRRRRESATEGEGGSVKGKVGNGPVITITTDRGAVTVKKS
jgi:hypothetical protein